MLTEKQFQELKQKEKLLKSAAEKLKVEEKDLPRVIKRFQDEIEKMKS